MPPAMRVAVCDAVGGHQAASVFQRLQNHRHGFPNMLAAKQGEVGGIRTVALHRVQDVGVVHAMG